MVGERIEKGIRYAGKWGLHSNREIRLKRPQLLLASAALALVGMEIKTEMVSMNLQLKVLVGRYKKMKREGMILTKINLAPLQRKIRENKEGL